MSPHGTILGTVSELHRHPVKSLTGERVPRLAVDERGVVGDRLWSVRDPDGKLGSGKSTRRFRRMPGLLELRARYEEPYDDGVPVLAFPDGRALRGDDPRPNLVVDTGDATGLPENDWSGRRVAIGPEVVLQVLYAMPRCVMVELPTADLPAERRLLWTVTEVGAGDLGVVADVVAGGTVSVGDPVSLVG